MGAAAEWAVLNDTEIGCRGRNGTLNLVQELDDLSNGNGKWGKL